MRDSKALLHTAGAVALGVAMYTFVVALFPSINPAAIAAKFQTGSTTPTGA
jgi:hypothetical protein